MIRLSQESDVLDLIGSRFSALIATHHVPGAQLAVHRAGRTAAICAGSIEYGTGRPVTPETAFPIGSITKAFTATLAMVLVGDGDLEIDVPLAEYLPELRGDPGDRITLRDLLSHTSGLACTPATRTGAGPTGSAASRDPVGSLPASARYAATHCRAWNLVAPPGAAFSYSSLGYVLAGRLIEAVTGMSWAEAMELVLLRPLGVTPAFVPAAAFAPATAHAPAPTLAPASTAGSSTRRPIATGHSANALTGRIRPVDQCQEAVEAPAGALAASALDLVALGLTHLDPGRPDLLPPAQAEAMRRPVPGAEPIGLADGWGLGLATYLVRSGDRPGLLVGHDGNADGTACYLRINPMTGEIVALTSNSTTGYRLWQDVLALLAEAGVAAGSPDAGRVLPPGGAGGEQRWRGACTGRYGNGDVEYEVYRDNAGNLCLTIDNETPLRVDLRPDLFFTLTDPSTGVRAFGGRFLEDPASGAVTSVHVGGRLAVRRTRESIIESGMALSRSSS